MHSHDFVTHVVLEEKVVDQAEQPRARQELVDEGERHLSETMTCFWSNFANSGDTNHGQVCDALLWPEYVWPSTKRTTQLAAAGMQLDANTTATNCTVFANLHQARCDLFEAYHFRL